MHGLAHAHYEADTEIVDEPAPYVSRARTEDLEMMVSLDDGRAHRPMTRTLAACDEEIPPGTIAYPTVYAGEMCKHGCWSRRELLHAQATNDIDAEDRRTGEFERIDLDAPARRADLADIMQRQQRRTERINTRLAELESTARKDTP